MKQKIFAYISTLGPIGYCYAPGTIATLVTAFFIFLLNYYEIALLTYLAIFILVFIASIYIINIALPCFVSDDPSEIVLDELLGCMVTFYKVSMNWQSVLFALIFFRFFDILKPFGLKELEKFNRAWGIVLDDVAAGLISNFLLRFILKY